MSKKPTKQRVKANTFGELPEHEQVKVLREYSSLPFGSPLERIARYHFRRKLWHSYGLTYLDIVNLIRWKYPNQVASARILAQQKSFTR